MGEGRLLQEYLNMQPKRTGLGFWLRVLIIEVVSGAFPDDSSEYVPEWPVV